MGELLTHIRAFLQELRRRHVYRVGATYLVVAFVGLQVADLLVPSTTLPSWTDEMVLALAVAGFPVALVLAWAFESTPDGIIRAGTVGATAPEPPSPGETAPQPDGWNEPADPRRLAVLPLARFLPEGTEDYFADGMTEELISVLSRIQGLEVIARTSVMAYRDTTKSVGEIARELHVGTLLEGSVRKVGDQLRITVQLVDAGTETPLWSRDYDREMREIFAVQSDIARNVADSLQVTLLGAEADRVVRVPTDDLEAYDLYLLGRHHLGKRSETGLRRALDHFERATELDPGFAPAHAGLADAYVLAAIGYAAVPDALGRAEAAAERALELDPELPDAHSSLGYVALNRDWDWRTAQRELGRALQLNPSDARARQWHAQVALYRRQFGEAARRYERARELDPKSVVIQNESGWPPLYMGEFDAAMRRFRRAASMDPSFALAHFNMGECHKARGRLEEAIASYRRAVELSSRTPIFVSFLGAALAEAGREREAGTLLGEIEARVEEGASLSLCLAIVHESLGETSRALDHLERALERREPLVAALDTTWLPMTSLRGEPRYEAVLEVVRDRLGVRG